MSLQPYPEYKDSGVEWLGEIPANWGCSSLGNLTQIVNGGTPTPADENWGGDVVWATPADMSARDGRRLEFTARSLTQTGLRTGSSSVRGGSVLLSTRAPIGYSVLTVGDIAFNQGCKALVPNPLLVSGYLLYALQSAKTELTSRGQGTTFLELTTNGLSSVKVPVPSQREQMAVVAFLDRETAEIDAFIADQEELIALLTERRSATISHAVTQGLDPAAPMKNSGVDWLGDVPSYWTLGQAKHFGSITLGKMLQDTSTREATFSTRYMRAANVQPGGMLALDDVKEMYFSHHEVQRLQLLRGDVVIVEGGVGGFGRAAHVAHDLDGWGFQNSIIRLRPQEGVVSGKFVAYQFIHLREVGYIEMAASVTSMPHFTVDKVSKTKVAWPQYTEQKAIADYLDRETAEIDATITDAREAIALSKERRAALISAAVTGKIDVRGHGASIHEGVK